MERFQDDKLTQALVALSGILFTQQTLNADLDRLVRLATHVIPTASGASISMLIAGGAATMATTDQVTLELDLVQYDNSEGPCLTALGGPVVRIGYIPTDERFPHFAIGAADTRVVSSLSIPVQHEGDIVGSLNLYSHQPNGFDATAEDTAMVFAAEAAVAIVNSTLYEQAHKIRGSLQEAHDRAAHVSRAQGVLMGMHQVSAAQAETLIRSAADSNGEGFHQAAQRILAAASEMEHPPPNPPND